MPGTTTYTTSFQDAVFTDHSTLSGSFTATYNPNGSIASISASSFIVTGASGQTTFSDAYVLSYADPNSTGDYELTFSKVSGSGGYTGLYVDFKGEMPAALSGGTATPYTSVRFNGSTLSLAAAGEANTTVACYLAGTTILTEHGEVPVEQLGTGSTVITQGGRNRRVRWVGRRSYAGRFLHARLHPICFAAGSLGEGLPRRDLYVSPDHAMFLDGVLVPAQLLVNGMTVTRDRSRSRLDYVHIELDSHDILLAEGAPSESFVDDGSRALFQNAHEYDRLGHADAPAVFCAPRVTSGEQLETIRRSLAPAGMAAAAA